MEGRSSGDIRISESAEKRIFGAGYKVAKAMPLKIIGF